MCLCSFCCNGHNYDLCIEMPTYAFFDANPEMSRDYRAIFYDGPGLCELLRLFASPHQIQEQATLLRESELQEHGITLRVKSLSGDVANLQVSRNDTITRLKSAVEAEFGMPASDLSLVCGATVLQGDRVIDDLISEEVLDPSAILHVVSKGVQATAGEIELPIMGSGKEIRGRALEAAEEALDRHRVLPELDDDRRAFLGPPV